MSTVKKVVPCPTCRKEVEWSTSNPWRPFCSERCQLIDLGEWAEEKKRIPGKPVSSWNNPDQDTFN